jgi:hypothetical protein
MWRMQSKGIPEAGARPTVIGDSRGAEAVLAQASDFVGLYAAFYGEGVHDRPLPRESLDRRHGRARLSAFYDRAVVMFENASLA